jgi:hypothetical protein
MLSSTLHGKGLHHKAPVVMQMTSCMLVDIVGRNECFTSKEGAADQRKTLTSELDSSSINTNCRQEKAPSLE